MQTELRAPVVAVRRLPQQKSHVYGGILLEHFHMCCGKFSVINQNLKHIKDILRAKIWMMEGRAVVVYDQQGRG